MICDVVDIGLLPEKLCSMLEIDLDGEAIGLR